MSLSKLPLKALLLVLTNNLVFGFCMASYCSSGSTSLPPASLIFFLTQAGSRNQLIFDFPSWLPCLGGIRGSAQPPKEGAAAPLELFAALPDVWVCCLCAPWCLIVPLSLPTPTLPRSVLPVDNPLSTFNASLKSSPLSDGETPTRCEASSVTNGKSFCNSWLENGKPF